MLFGKTDKDWTYCLTVCLSVVHLSCMPESYIESPPSLANCSACLHLAAWPSTSHHHGLDSSGCCMDIKLLLCWSHLAKLSLCRALLACVCQDICTELSLFLLSSCCFFFFCLGSGVRCMDKFLWQRNVFTHAYTTDYIIQLYIHS